MGDIISTAIKSISSVIILFILTRLMGKKQISQLTFFDYVAGISIGSIAATFAIDPNINYEEGITGLITYAAFAIILSYISLKSYAGRKLLDGRPTILIQDGKIIEHNLMKVKFNVNDLLEELRLKDAFDISEVDYAILESSGKVSVLKKSPNQAVTLKDLNLNFKTKGLGINLIIDGKIIKDHLKYLDLSEQWLINELKLKNIKEIDDVLLAYLDTSNNIICFLKNEQTNPKPIL